MFTVIYLLIVIFTAWAFLWPALGVAILLDLICSKD